MTNYEWDCPYCLDGGNDVSEDRCSICYRKPPSDPATYRRMVEQRNRDLRESMYSVHHQAVNMHSELP